MQKFLQVLGVVFLLQLAVIVAVIGYIRWVYQPDPRPVGEMTQFEFIFNWSGLNPDQDYKVIQSYQVSRAWNGDFFQWACIEISEFEEISTSPYWVSGSEQNNIFDAVRRSAGDFGEMGNCFAKEDRGNEEKISARIRRIEINGRNDIEGATVIFFDSQSKRILYIEWQT